jgi:uncharacterized protein YndB with AHSA1/START domain
MNAANQSEPATPGRTHVERLSARELFDERVFRARTRTVFEATTKPEHLKRWWAPRSFGVVLFECDADVRVGGSYRYVFGHEGQARMAFSGVYKEVVPGEKVVHTQIFEPMAAMGEAVVTVTFEAHEEGTLLVSHAVYPSKEALDGAIASGMERGIRNTYEQLAALVVELDPIQRAST